MSRRFWVYIEQEDGQVNPVAWELLGVARRLASEVENEPDQEPVTVEGVLVGSGDGLEMITQEAFHYGAERVYVVEDLVYDHYRNSPYCQALVFLAEKYQPEVFLIGATTLGRDLAGAVATSLGTGLTADCTHLQMGEVKGSLKKLLLATRPAFGGNVIATIVCRNHRPQMASVRPRVFPMAEPDRSHTGEVVREAVLINKEEIGVELVRLIRNAAENANIEFADVLVSGGRGVGGPAGFTLLKELADAIGGTVASTRPCVDAGWIGYDHQVGQTGKTVRPKVYIAIGISGAI